MTNNFLGFVVIAVAATFVGCSRMPDEEAVAATIDAIVRSAESGKSGELMSYVAEDFGTQDGAMDRDDLRRFVIAQVRINRNVNIALTGMQIDIIGDRADAEMRALVTGGNRRFIPERGRVFDVAAGFRRDGSTWQLINARWTPAFGD